MAHSLAFPGHPVCRAELPLLSTPQSSGTAAPRTRASLHCPWGGKVLSHHGRNRILVASGSCNALSVASVGLALTLALCVLLSDSGQQQPSSVGNQSHSASDPGPIRATAPMWRCSRIMHMQRELHPTLLSSLEGIVDQMVWFRENWHEEVGGPDSAASASLQREWTVPAMSADAGCAQTGVLVSTALYREDSRAPGKRLFSRHQYSFKSLKCESRGCHSSVGRMLARNTQDPGFHPSTP